jgi:hypothetical protein
MHHAYNLPRTSRLSSCISHSDPSTDPSGFSDVACGGATRSLALSLVSAGAGVMMPGIHCPEGGSLARDRLYDLLSPDVGARLLWQR